MRADAEVAILKAKIESKKVLSDYDLGVLNTLKWLSGQPDPYLGRTERA